MAADRRVSGLMVVAMFSVLSLASALPRHRRQTGGNQGYGQGSGEGLPVPPGPDPNLNPNLGAPCTPGEVGSLNCSHYFECSSAGVRTPIQCAAGTVANPNGIDIFSICAWPDEVPQCRAAQQGADDVDPRLQDACNQPPADVRPGQAYHVPHPIFCNAYLTCGRGRVFLACVICAEGTIFNPAAGRCLPGGRNDCQGGPYVMHELVTNTTLYDDSCRMPGGPGEPGLARPQGQGQGPIPQGQGQGYSSQEQGQGPVVPPGPAGPQNPPPRGTQPNPYPAQNQPQNPFAQQPGPPRGGPWYYRRY